VMLIGISLWDIISVKKGPIKSIMENVVKKNPEVDKQIKLERYEILDIEDADIEIGIGDLAFYSVLSSFSIVFPLFNNREYSIVLTSLLLTSIGILIGTFLTVLALKKNKILPGLPLSIFIGLSLFFITNFVF